MENKITGLSGSAPRPPEPRQSVKGAEADTAAPPRRDGDRVNVTDSARSIQQSERAQAAAPAVDAGRVAAVRQELADGRYAISPERIADRLLTIEQQLTGKV